MLLPIASKRVAATKGIGPRDVLEGMIAAQMLACHDAAMLCFRHAVDSKWGSHLRREHLNQAGKRYSAIDEDELVAREERRSGGDWALI
jgi:hypothetical protein